MALEDIPRDQIVISTKKSSQDRKAEEVAPSCEESLKKLGTDYIDVYSLHGVFPWDYVRCRDELYPELLKLKEAGKIRYIGITEMFNSDKTHEMLQQGFEDDIWEVAMVGFNILNQTARVEYRNATSNNSADGAAAWGYDRYTAFGQATWQVLDNLELRRRLGSCGAQGQRPGGRQSAETARSSSWPMMAAS